MSKLYMDSDDLLTSIKLRAAVPLAQVSFSDQDLLNFASEEIDLKVVPSILSVREEYYVTTERIPLVANQSAYNIPYRAIGGRVRFVYLESTDGTVHPLAQIAMEHLPDYQVSSFSYRQSGFYLENDKLVLLPPMDSASSATGNLIIKYYMKPNKVVETTRGGQIKSIATNPLVATQTDIEVYEDLPANITASSEVDFIQSKSNHKTKGFDVIVQAIPSKKILTINTSDLPSDLVVGDFVCSAGESVIPQVPSELQVMVAQAVACRVLEAIGDTQGLANATSKLSEMEVKLLAVVDSRVEAPGKKVVNTTSFLNNRRRVRRWNY